MKCRLWLQLETQLSLENRSISLSATEGSITVVTIYPKRESSNQPQWTIYGNSNITQYTLPETIESFGDPLASQSPSRFIRSSNMHLKSGHNISQSLFETDGIKNLFDKAVGFATHNEAW